MFTGIITAVGKLESNNGTSHRFVCPIGWLTSVSIGDSIAVNGACLTVTNLEEEAFFADICVETKQRCAPFVLGAAVNLEHSLAIGDKLGGHFVTGHVDGMALLAESTPGRDGGRNWRLSPPLAVRQYIAEKGSVTLAGVSLTVNNTEGNGDFSVYLIPHTLEKTVLSSLSAGDAINLEVDLLARHVGRLLAFGNRQ